MQSGYSEDAIGVKVSPQIERIYPSPGTANYSLAILMVVTFTALLDRYLVGLLLEPIQTEFAITDTQVSLLQGLAFAIFYSVMGLPFGRLVDRGNRRTIITVGVFVWSAMTIACGLAPTYGFLFVARLGVGLGEACLAPAAYSLITDLFPPQRHGRALAAFTLSSVVGGGGSFIIGGAALKLATYLHSIPVFADWAPWRMTFLIVGAPGLLAGLLMLTVREPARHIVGGPTKLPDLRELWAFLRQVRGPLGALTAAAVLTQIAGTGVVGWLAVCFQRTHGVPVAQNATIIGLCLIISAVVAGPISGWFADWRRTRNAVGRKVNVVAWGCLICVPFALFFPLLPTATLSMAVFFFYAMLYNIHACAAPAALQDILPNRFKGQVSAIYWLVVGLLGLGGGSTLVAVVTERLFADPLALRYAISLVASISLGGAAIILLATRSIYQKELDRQASPCPT